MKLKSIMSKIRKFLNATFIISPLHFYERVQYKSTKYIVAVSETSKKVLIQHYGINSRKIKVIPDCVNLNKFKPSNQSNEIRQKYGNNILLYSGLMIRRKKIPVLLEAMKNVIKEVPDVHLILTGIGPFLNEWKELSISLGIQNNVSFLGFVGEKELLKYYASIDIFVFPSQQEGFGQVIIEAMASGTPVICANIPPMSKIVGNGGLTFKLNNPINLSEKIIFLLKNREQLNKLRENALKIAKNYQCSRIAELYIDYIKKIKNLD